MRIIDLIPESWRQRLWPGAVGGTVTKPGWMMAFDDMKTKYDVYQSYYSGRVLDTLADPKRPDDGLKYPLRLNVCRTWAHMMASYLWGEWDKSVVSFQVERKKQESGKIAEEEEKRCASMEEVLRRLWMEQENDALADTASIDLMVYGGTVPKVYWDNLEKKIATDWLCPDIVAPRWDPMNVNRLVELYVVFDMAREDAKDIFGLNVTDMPELVHYVERWTPDTFQAMVDNQEVKAAEVNPLGFIPHIYIPRLRGPDNYGYFGLSTLTDTTSIQDEINLRAADIGDGIAYSSHPIRWVVDYTGKDDLEVGADALWNLGLSMGGRRPQAGALDVKTNYKEGMEFIQEVERFGRNSSSLPPIAFGEDEGSQRSSLTLLVRYLPLTQEIRRERLHMASGLRRWAKLSLRLAVKHGEEVGGVNFELEHIDSHIININFAPVIPRSVEDLVNQWNIRIQGGFGTPEEAYEDLGHPQPKEAAEKALEYAQKVAKMKPQGGANVAGTNGGAGRNGPAGAGARPKDGNAGKASPSRAKAGTGGASD